MLLAADIGGTHARIGLFSAGDAPVRVTAQEYATGDVGSVDALVARLRADAGPFTIDAAAVAIAGPVHHGAATLTNGDWGTSEAAIAHACGTTRVRLLNDLAALAWGTLALRDEACATLLPGEPDPAGPRAVIAPGTGLGEARVHFVEGRPVVLGTEAGHADFAPITPLDARLARDLRARHGRATVEHVLSGPGLLALHAVTHGDTACQGSGARERRPEDVTSAALEGRCAACREAVHAWAAALGAEAGNLALRELATGGVYLGGGIVPALLPVLRSAHFTGAFLDKAPMRALVARVPVRVILDPGTGLMGAALAAASLA